MNNIFIVIALQSLDRIKHYNITVGQFVQALLDEKCHVTVCLGILLTLPRGWSLVECHYGKKRLNYDLRYNIISRTVNNYLVYNV